MELHGNINETLNMIYKIEINDIGTAQLNTIKFNDTIEEINIYYKILLNKYIVIFWENYKK